MPQMFTCTLTLEQWNEVLAAMGEAPFRKVAPIINAMDAQFKQQSQPVSEKSDCEIDYAREE